MLNFLISVAMRSPALRIALNAIHVRELAAAVLRRRPLLRKVPGSSLIYRVTTLDNLVVAREVFSEGEYGSLSQFRDIRTFADLGCNCGYFTLFAASISTPETIRGLAVDAHPDMVAATTWHVEKNGLRNVHPVWGLLGASEAANGRFFVNVDAAGSSQFDRSPDANVTANPWREITAPVVSLTEEWSRRFGDAPCDVLKIDIEGSEDAFLRREVAFLQRVGVLAIEMHKWIVDVASLDAFLAQHGFDPHEVLRSDDSIHVALYVNRNGRFHRPAPALVSAGATVS
jgi:FkbM family methyltransferase